MALEIPALGQPTAPAGPAAATARHRPLRGRRAHLARSQFTERLALLIETGSPLHGALGTLADQLDADPVMQALVRDLMERVIGGKPFSQACRNHPAVFPDAWCQLVAAGESGGFLIQILKELVLMDEKSASLRASVAAAFSYPAFLAAFSVAVTVFVLVWVFPRFGDLFHSIHDDLPITTRALLALSELLRAHALLIGLGLAVSATLLGRWLRQAEGSAMVDHLKLRLPLLRDIMVRIYLIQVLRLLALALERGVSAMDALKAARNVVANSEFRAFLARVELGVAEGRGLAAGFRDVPFLPPMVYQMVSTGEQTGSLALVFGRVADFYERELNRLLATFGRLVEPTMLLVMGSVVGLMVSSLILPIFRIARAVH